MAGHLHEAYNSCRNRHCPLCGGPARARWLERVLRDVLPVPYFHLDKCRIVSGEDMQKLRAKVLASEANSPGAFSRKTANLIADLDKTDAELFTRLCSFGSMIGNVCPLLFNVQGDIYNRNGINFGSVIHLESLGLIQFNNLTSFNRVQLPQKFFVFYYGRPVELTMPKDADNELELGHVLLTQAGQQLAPICGSTPLAEFFDFVYDSWAAKSYVPKRATEPARASEPAVGPVANGESSPPTR